MLLVFNFVVPGSAFMYVATKSGTEKEREREKRENCQLFCVSEFNVGP